MFFTQPSVSSSSSPPLVIQFSSVCPSTDHTTCPARVHLPARSPVTDPCFSFLLPALPGPPAATQPTAMYFTQPSANSSASAPVVVQFSSHTSPPKERVPGLLYGDGKSPVYKSLSTLTKHDTKRIQLPCIWSSYVIRRSYTILWTALLPLCQRSNAKARLVSHEKSRGTC